MVLCDLSSSNLGLEFFLGKLEHFSTRNHKENTKSLNKKLPGVRVRTVGNQIIANQIHKRLHRLPLISEVSNEYDTILAT